MAISGKPPKPVQAEVKRQPDEQEVRKLINKGGSVAEGPRLRRKPARPSSRCSCSCGSILTWSGNRRGAKTTPGGGARAPSRHAWIVKAIEEKLARTRVVAAYNVTNNVISNVKFKIINNVRAISGLTS